jgi:serine/threonine-protein kinase
LANQLGKYQLIAEIARGGMGIVHLAVAQGLARFSKLLVIKELKPEYVEDETFLEMFLEEARLAARLNHPNIVQTYEVGEEKRRYYLVMDYLDGVSLARVVRRNSPSFTMNMRLRVICEVLQGLEYAHTLKDFDGSDLGIVHRDVNPSNVFITFDGQAKLVDFGIAKAIDSTIETRTGILKGKPAYMAPEQIAGDADARADVFSAGVMIWEAAAGARMWARKGDVEVVAHMLKAEVPNLREVAPDVPEALAQIVEKALAKHRADRYESARALQEALEEYLKGDETATMRAVGTAVSGIFVEERATRKNKIDAQLALLKALTSGGAGSADAPLPVLESGAGFSSSSSNSGPLTTAGTSISAISSSDGVPISLPPDAKGRKKAPILIGLFAILLTAVSFFIGIRATKTPETVSGHTAAPPEASTPPPLASTVEAKPSPPAVVSTAAPSAPPTTEKPKILAPARPVWTPPRPSPVVRPPPPPPEARPPAAPAPSTNCSPPFYYEGSKKIFKPGCL